MLHWVLSIVRDVSWFHRIFFFVILALIHRQQSSWNGNSSVVHPCRNYLSSWCTDFFQILVVAFLWTIRWGNCFYFCLFIYLFIYLFILRILFVFFNMGPYGSKNFKTLLLLQIAAGSFQTSPDFFPSGPHKITFVIVEIWKFKLSLIYSSAWLGYSMGLMASHSFCCFPAKRFLKIPCDSPHKSCW